MNRRATWTRGTTATTLDLFGDLHEQGTTIIMITHEREVAARAGREMRTVDGILTALAS